MNDKQGAIKLIQDFIKNRIESESWYQDVRPYLKAIILYGSVAKGTNREDSDVDILFILPLEIEEKYTKGEYFYKYLGQEINIVIRSIERLREITKGKHDAFQAEIFRQSEIIWQKDDETSRLIKKIQQIDNQL